MPLPNFVSKNLGFKNYKMGDRVDPSGFGPGVADFRTPTGVPNFAPPSFQTSGLNMAMQGPETLKNVMGVLGYNNAQPGQPGGEEHHSGVGGFLRDNAGAVIGGLTGLYGAYSQNKQANEDRALARQELERQHRIDDEERARRKTVDPVRAQIIKRMLEQAQSAGQYTGYGA